MPQKTKEKSLEGKQHNVPIEHMVKTCKEFNFYKLRS